jgi:DNA-binding winged helix-turn-helix (wHTH) protein/TolB-like protein/Tfp pilus assembly protein PilF
MSGPQTEAHVRRFGPFEANLRTRELRKNGYKLKVHGTPVEVLAALLERPGDLVTREELFKRLWPDGTFVDFDNNLNSAVKRLREALGDSADHPRYIETLPKLGYRFVAEVGERTAAAATHMQDRTNRAVEDSQARQTEVASPRVKPRFQSAWIWAASLIVLAVVIVSLFSTSRPAPQQAAPAWRPRSVAVLPFRSARSAAETKHLGEALQALIAERLSYDSQFVVRAADMIWKAFEPGASAEKTAQGLQAAYLVSGSYSLEDGKLLLVGEITDVARGATLWRGTLSGAVESPAALANLMAEKVGESLQTRIASGPSVPRSFASSSSRGGAMKFFTEGIALEVRGDNRAARALHEKALRLAPESDLIRAHLAFTLIYERYGFYDSTSPASVELALDAYAKALEKGAASPALLSQSGLHLIELGRLEDGVELLRAALKLNPSHAEAHLWLGQAYRYAGMLNESLQAAQTAMRLDPNTQEVSTLNTYLYLGEYDRFLASMPGNVLTARGLFYRGLAEFSKGNALAADRLFAQAIELEPLSSHAQFGQAIRLASQGDAARAKQVLKSIEAQVHPDGEMQYKLAQAYAVGKDYEGAMRAFARSVRADFVCYDYFLRDPLLSELRQRDDFKALLQESLERHQKLRVKLAPAAAANPS